MGRHKQACTNNRHQKRPNLPLEGLLFTPWVIFAAMRGLFVLLTSQLASFCIGQTNFGTSQQNPNPSSDVNTRLFTGNQALDSGLVGIGLGALGATFLAPAVGNALNGGNNNGFNNGFNDGNNNGFNNGFNSGSFNACGKRRKRQVDGQSRFFLPNGGGCTCGKRKKRQAQSRIFFGGNNNDCGSCCYNNGYSNGFSNGNSNNFNQGNYNQGNYNQGSSNQGNYNQGSFNSGGCQCDYSLTFLDQNWNTQGACRRTDNTGRTWCYTTGWNNNGCGDLQTSQRFPNNPWSYNACSYSG